MAMGLRLDFSHHSGSLQNACGSPHLVSYEILQAKREEHKESRHMTSFIGEGKRGSCLMTLMPTSQTIGT